MAEDKKEKPKIIIDDDWKTQAEAEKKRLADEVEQQAEGPEADEQLRELPPANFSTLVSSMVAQIFFSLGGLEDPKTKKRYVDLDLAKHHIDVLAVLEEKTKGNLTDDEKKLLDQSLYETRMQYVQVAQNVIRAPR
jgi:hypothetical protein